jgi:hypothetical protein
MSKCVFRTDLHQRPVGEPLLCIDAVEMFFRPGMPTVEQCVQLLLTGEEICLGVSERRAIMLGAKVVGYIRIVDACTWAPTVAAHRSCE